MEKGQSLLQKGLMQIAKMQNLTQNELDQITKMQNQSRGEPEQMAKMRRIKKIRKNVKGRVNITSFKIKTQLSRTL